MFIFSIIILFISLCISFKAYQYGKTVKNKQIQASALYKTAQAIQIQKQEQQKAIDKEINQLSSKKTKLLNDITSWERQNSIIKENAKKQIQEQINTYKQKASYEVERYIESLQIQKNNEQINFENQKNQYQNQLNSVKNELDKLKSTRAAAHEALLKQQQVKDNKQKYCLIPNQNDLDDIYKLQRIKKDLHKPRILSMLIWQTYWQPLAKKQFPQILGTAATKTGIYKITNLKTNDCYIGQSLDIYKRWCQHCKCGLGIDTPVGNKLYKAMFQYGLQNFTFELLEECPKDALTLNEKEKYFIELYDAKNFGYNSTGGNK